MPKPRSFRCAVDGCDLRTPVQQLPDGISLFGFPTRSLEICSLWVEACGRKSGEVNIKYEKVCSRHFTGSDYQTNSIDSVKPRLRDVAIPNKCLSAEAFKRETTMTSAVSDTDTALIDNMEEMIESCSEFFEDCEDDNEGEVAAVPDANVNTESFFEAPTNYTLFGDETDEEIRELVELEKRNNELKELIAESQKKLDEVQKLERNLGRFFTQSEIKRLMKPSKRFMSGNEDKIASKALYSAVGAQTYTYLSHKGFPHASVQTVRGRTSTNRDIAERIQNVIASADELPDKDLDTFYLRLLKLVQTSPMHDDETLCEERHAHINARKIPCVRSDCHKMFSSRLTMRKHAINHRPMPCLCEECGKSFTNSIRLKRHRAIHQGKDDRPFVCPYKFCEKSFACEAYLMCHLDKSHSKLRFPCAVDGCDVGFKTQDDLDSHVQQEHGLLENT